jgi:transcriptional regulator with XRE-family HTH domain
MNNLKSNLVILRKDKNLTQQDIADFLGISRTSYTRYESSIESSIDNLIKLADLFQVSLDQLVGREPSDNQKVVINFFTKKEIEKQAKIISKEVLLEALNNLLVDKEEDIINKVLYKINKQ